MLGSLIAQTARQWRRAVDRELQPFGLTEATWLPLLRVARAREPMRQKDLAESLSLYDSSVVRLLDNLQEKGLIERREGADRRAKTIHLTDLGKASVDRVEGISRQVRERTLANIPDKDIENISGILEQICSALSPANQEDAA
jgi:MarR family transcriptional regulator for hemolysin